MIILVSSKIDQSNIQASLGTPEYSYFFLLKEFLPALERLGTVRQVQSREEIEELVAQYRTAGEQVVLLSFSPPHQTPIGLPCPTVAVFAWEFDSLPATQIDLINVESGYWYAAPENDWRQVFNRISGTIATSRETANLVAQVIKSPQKVAAIPASIWDRYQNLCPNGGWNLASRTKQFSFKGLLIDSRKLKLNADDCIAKPISERTRLNRALLRGWWHEVRLPTQAPSPSSSLTAPAKPPAEEQQLTLKGIVYTSVFNPADGRKNWTTLITAFCWALREQEDATLVLKMSHNNIDLYRTQVLALLARLAPFKCRVVVVHGFLEDSEYRKLIEVTDFYVNCSSGEGLCIPLMEFLSSGKPAIAPLHTAMADYLDESFAFIVASSKQLGDWPHDPTGLNNTCSRRINWDSLRQAYSDSHVLSSDAQRYKTMSCSAHREMERFCSAENVSSQLQHFLQHVLDQEEAA
ncbi:glycosyltransferase [Ectopseudomonas mendocina]|uniref:Glycosyltransferase n=1 Tax=Ectopseudomonas mendocina TaxID=300 RepID=A0ABZ2RI24_ECTME